MINKIIDNLSIEEKIGQMIMAGFYGFCISEHIIELVTNLKVGGLILYERNIESKRQLTSLIKEINYYNKNIELFINIDEEGGRVTRLPKDENMILEPCEIGKLNDYNLSYINGKHLGNKLNTYGINMNNAPVLDILTNEYNTVIKGRAFSNDKEVVANMGVGMMKGIQSKNVIPTVKHFPGHGDMKIDSHLGLPILYREYEDLINLELYPFIKAIENGCDSIMLGHILLSQIDNIKLTTISKTIIEDILRNELGFNGLIITDDMNMAAITNTLDIEKACVSAVEAGVDIILLESNINTVKLVISEIRREICKGNISEKRINESVYRILQMKTKYNILK